LILKGLPIIVMILASFFSSAQRVLVLDENNQPIPETLVIGDSLSVLSDSLGAFEISIFGLNESIKFKHSGYFGTAVTRNQLVNEMGGTLILKHRETILDPFEIHHKWELDNDEMPIGYLEIKPAELILMPNQTAADLVGSTGQVFIQKSQYGGGSPMIRGFSANRILIVVDGVRMNNAIFRSGNLQNIISIDPNTIQSGEVILGP